MGVIIKASSYDGHANIPLIQQTTKRDKGPQFVNVNLSKFFCKRSVLTQTQ